MAELPERRGRGVTLRPGVVMPELPKFVQSPGAVTKVAPAERVVTPSTKAAPIETPAQDFTAETATHPEPPPVATENAMRQIADEPSNMPAKSRPTRVKAEKTLQPASASERVVIQVRGKMTPENSKLLEQVLAKWRCDPLPIIAMIARSVEVTDDDFRKGGLIVRLSQSGESYRGRIRVPKPLLDVWREKIDPAQRFKVGEVCGMAANIAFNRTATEVLKSLLREV